ncbi:MAG: DUF2141 domain-containing protein [Bacteroidota bacterium]
MKYLFFLTIFAVWQMPTDETTTTLTVHITDIDNAGQGTLHIMLYDTPAGFPQEPANAKYRGKVENFGSSTQYVFEAIPYGKYAISVHQDENNNGEMDTNFVGIPKEPIAAYNMTGLGRPQFQKSLVTLSQDRQAVTLKMLND